jgi:ribonuclease HII
VGCDATLERELVASGFHLIAGVDEVGRGALAGPVVAAAVIFDLDDLPEGIDDSKKLTRIKRERLAAEIKRRAVGFAIARVEHDAIDRLNIHRASLLAMQMAVKALQPPPECVLIDGRHTLPNLNCPQRAVVKGDSISVSIAAASIIAKVARDRWMKDYDEKYPGYGFASHVGYSTFAHQEALARLGPSPIHRKTFRSLSYQPLLDLMGAHTVRLESPDSLKHRPRAK